MHDLVVIYILILKSFRDLTYYVCFLISALHFAACMSGPTDVLQVLIENGADINGVNDEHATPLFFACQCNNQYAASMLIDQGVDVRLRNMQGMYLYITEL